MLQTGFFRIASLIVAVSTLGFVAGCGSDNDTSGQPSQGGSSGAGEAGGASGAAEQGGSAGTAEQGGSSGSGEAGAPGNGGSAPAGSSPTIISFATSSSKMHEDQSVTFSAVVTDPDGIDDLIGGTLLSDDESATYGTFATSAQEGAYSLTLSWDQINDATPINLAGEKEYVFKARFFDVAGHATSQTRSLRLSCSSAPDACDGKCTDTSSDLEHCGSCGNKCDGCASGTCYRWSSCNTDISKNCDQICGAQGKTCASMCGTSFGTLRWHGPSCSGATTGCSCDYPSDTGETFTCCCKQ